MATIEHPYAVSMNMAQQTATEQLIVTGIALGIVHVLTGPDHLSALATLCGTNILNNNNNSKVGKSSRFEHFLLGIKWGIGHSVGLVIVGCILITIQESTDDGYLMDDWWSDILNGFVGLFMLTLGLTCLSKAFKNRKKEGSQLLRAWTASCVGSLKEVGSNQSIGSIKKEKDDDIHTHDDNGTASMTADSMMMVEKLDISEKSKSSGGVDDSISERMKEVLHDDESASEVLSRVSEQSHSIGDNSDDGDLGISDRSSDSPSFSPSWLVDASERSGRSFGLDQSDRSDSFKKYNANKPKLAKASSILKSYATPETSIVSTPNKGPKYVADKRKRNCARLSNVCFASTPSLALIAGLIHGVAGVGGILGIVPAMELQDAKLASVYLFTFCLTSTLVMGCFAASYGSFSKWLAAGGDGRRVFLVEAISACLSIAVGIAWLVLLYVGELDTVFYH